MRLSLLAVPCVLVLADGIATAAYAVENPSDDRQGMARSREITADLTNNTVERQNFVMSKSFIYFHGLISNRTMHQTGRLSIVIGEQERSELITVRVHASDGLLGNGELSGMLSQNGRFFASGQLLMGSNPFTCNLTGTVKGGKLNGSAKFVHNANGRTAYGSFSLVEF